MGEAATAIQPVLDVLGSALGLAGTAGSMYGKKPTGVQATTQTGEFEETDPVTGQKIYTEPTTGIRMTTRINPDGSWTAVPYKGGITYQYGAETRAAGEKSLAGILGGKLPGTTPETSPWYRMIAPGITKATEESIGTQAAQMAGMYQRGGMGLSQEDQERKLRAEGLTGMTSALGQLGMNLMTPTLQAQEWGIEQAGKAPENYLSRILQTGSTSKFTPEMTAGGK